MWDFLLLFIVNSESIESSDKDTDRISESFLEITEPKDWLWKQKVSSSLSSWTSLTSMTAVVLSNTFTDLSGDFETRFLEKFCIDPALEFFSSWAKLLWLYSLLFTKPNVSSVLNFYKHGWKKQISKLTRKEFVTWPVRSIAHFEHRHLLVLKVFHWRTINIGFPNRADSCQFWRRIPSVFETNTG